MKPRTAAVFNQPEPNGEDGSENIQPNGIEQLFGPTRPEDEREFNNDDGDGKSDVNTKASVPPSKERITMSTSKYDLKKRISNIILSVYAAAAEGIDKIASLLTDAIDAKSQIYQAGQVAIEAASETVATEYTELIEFIKKDKGLSEKYAETVNSGVDAAFKQLKERMEAALKKMPEEKARVGDFIQTIRTSSGTDLLEDAEKKLKKFLAEAREKANELKERVKELKSKKADYSEKKFCTNIETIARKAKVAAKDEIKEAAKAKKSEPEAPAAKEAPAAPSEENPEAMEKLRDQIKKQTPEKKPAPGVGKIRDLFRKKKPAASAWIDDMSVTSAADLGALLQEMDTLSNEFLATMEPTVSEAEELNEEFEATISELESEASSLDLSAPADEAGEEAMESDEFHSDEAPAEEAPAEEAPAHAPAAPAQPEMEALPASLQSDLDKTAKAFPSEHDQSGNLLEVVEADGDGQKQLVVNKQDVRTKITKKVEDQFVGAFSSNESVCVDFGDYISNGVVTAYVKDGIYKVAMEDGRDLEIPRANIFSASSAKKLWE